MSLDQVPRRGRSVPFAVLTLAATLLGCASAAGRTPQARPHPVDVEVRNNLLLPTDLTVYVLRDYGAGRTLLGSVSPGRTQTLRFTPVTYTEVYRLYANPTGGRPIRSQPFTIGSDMTGRIVWTLVPNIVGFEDVSDSTTSDSSTRTPPASPTR